MIRRYLPLPIVVCFLLWSWAGCASGRSELLSKYDDLPFKDMFLYDGPPTDVIRALSEAMYERGGSVTMINKETGIVSAELETGELLPEERHAAAVGTDKDDDSLVTIIFAGIVAAFLFIILFGWLGDGCGSSDTDEEHDAGTPDRRHRPDRRPDRQIIIVDPDDDVIRGFRYVFTFTVQDTEQGQTSVRMRTLRQESENGVIVRSVALQNAYLNYALNEKVRAELARP